MTVKLNTKKLDNLIKIARDTYKVKIGIIGSAGKQKDSTTGLTVAEYAQVNEFGSITKAIPERSFIRSPLEKHLKEAINNNLLEFNTLLFEEQKIIEAYDRLSVLAEKIILDSFSTKNDGEWADNKETTIKHKGVNNPLYNTGRLKKSINSKVVKQ